MYTKFLKRTGDFLIALIALTLLLPVFIFILIFLTFANRGKPFFYQHRPGYKERIFRIIKFRTMNDRKDMSGDLLPDNQRLTSIGAFIRKTSLDEIPQLLNVIKGDMSIIGPRPLLIRYLPFYTDHERKRHSVRPGITGLAQVSGRNLLPWEERLALDVEYVQNLSFALDCTILVKTFQRVLTSKDVVADPQSVMIDLDEYRKKT
ncbi:sugar transferase [Ascidiimonas aurantiaca]|uniref:sugar transferase n=1 Tax=Ascidiimonas aurantiaca TaxID=1685432 RepID=UPI0030EE2327